MFLKRQNPQRHHRTSFRSRIETNRYFHSFNPLFQSKCISLSNWEDFQGNRRGCSRPITGSLSMCSTTSHVTCSVRSWQRISKRKLNSLWRLPRLRHRKSLVWTSPSPHRSFSLSLSHPVLLSLLFLVCEIEEQSFQSLGNVRKASVEKIPNFKVVGHLDSAQLLITHPLTGEVCVEESDAIIKSIELQLVRVETCGCAEGWAKEGFWNVQGLVISFYSLIFFFFFLFSATEIQNIQIADGDVLRGLKIPIFMIFPRLFTAPTVSDRTFKVEFEVNLVVVLADGHLISENLPIVLIRN